MASENDKETELVRIDDVGLCWMRFPKRGKKVIIVVDDNFEDALAKEPLDAHGWGLWEIWQAGSRYEGMLAIAFFDLHDVEAEIKRVEEEMINWLRTLGDSIACYVMVDLFRGQGKRGSVAGETVRERLKRLFASHSIPMKLSVLSVNPVSSVTKGEMSFAKEELQRSGSGKLPNRLLRWLDIVPHPLTEFWTETSNWFRDGESDDDIMVHDSARIQKYFCSGRSDMANVYIQNVRDKVVKGIPDHWWDNIDIVKQIHESIKNLCGAQFCGNVKQGSMGIHYFSVGSAYLLALKAHEMALPDVPLDTLTNTIDWTVFTDRPLMYQTGDYAKRYVEAVFDLFKSIFAHRVVEKKEELNKSHVVSAQFVVPRCLHCAEAMKQVGCQHCRKTANLHYYAAILEIEMDWPASTPAENRRASLAEKLPSITDLESIPIPLSVQQTTDAILRFWRALLPSAFGFMGPGSVYMHKNKLVIGSVGREE